MEELKKLFGEMQSAFSEFRSTNDERLKSIEKKGSADGLLDEKLEKINTKLSELEKDIEQKRLAANRAPLYGPHGENLLDLTAEERSDYDAMKTYLRKGTGTEYLETRALTSGLDTDAGYLLAKPTVGRIAARVYETTPLRQYADVQTISSSKLTGPTDLNEADSGWVGENENRVETNTPAVGEYSIEVFEQYAEPQASQRFLDDAAVDVEQWLAEKVASKFARMENAGYATGNGVKRPRGVFSYATAATGDATRAWGTPQHINTGVSGAFASSNPADQLIDLVHTLKVDYRAGAAWMLPRLTLASIRKFKDTTGQYLWQPALVAGNPSSLLGYPVIEAEDAPAVAANSIGVAFGNFKVGYQIVDRLGVRVIRDAITKKGWVKFYTTKRTGGDIVNFEAIKFLRFGT
ncbi:COG4653 Predicted phage phi-C31 gp36 major capsid-like protein [uncultured Caudovirales phage]|uniref:COG4653 Predicted phage phi-C31 gp36 major capsid-like protein n=1 Tax=uncultured Caudovirales phage TaxID=2100421 RepID=A0A6J5LYZ1_9CAUD|nr:COG4653 Predicted phage phi-C31 gp36 major capsid-like protein [uncultured Caudovirales phage]